MDATDSVTVAPENTDQLRAWDGDEGAYWAAHASHFDRSALPFHERLLAAADVAPGDRVLDVGCGAGQSTVLAARASGTGLATGVDLSSRMLVRARDRAATEGATNTVFEHADAQVHPFVGDSSDVVISNMGATFFGDAVTGFTNLARALRPGGRLALVTWQAFPDNEWIGELRGALAAGRDLPVPPPGSQGPFALADADRVRDVLGRAGFGSIDVAGAHERMWFGDDVDDAYGFVLGLLGWMLTDLDAAGRERARDDLRSTCVAHETPDGVVFDSAIWTVTAIRP